MLNVEIFNMSNIDTTHIDFDKSYMIPQKEKDKDADALFSFCSFIIKIWLSIHWFAYLQF